MANLFGKMIVGGLNAVPKLMKSNGGARAVSIIVFAMVSLCLALCFWMVSGVEPKLAFFVDSYRLPALETVTVGEQSDVSFKDVPHDYLSVTFVGDDSVKWKVNEQYRDSLMYFKINDENPQKHVIRNSPDQVVRVCLPASEYGSGDTLELTGEQIWDEWDDFEDQKDVLVRQFAARYGFMHCNDSAVDSLRWQNYCQLTDLRSFFERNDGSIVMVILDNSTTVTDEDGTVGYRFEGSCAADDVDRRCCCKVQFFSLSDYCYMDNDDDDGSFRIGDVNYVMKASVMLTEWGAGHVMLRRDSGSGEICVSFPKAIGFVGTLDSLYRYSGGTNHMFTFKQAGNTFPTGGDIYLPQFSGSVNQDICEVLMKGSGEDVELCGNDNELVPVTGCTTGVLPFSLVPALSSVNLPAGDAMVNCRVGYVDTGFALSYIYLPLLVFLVLAVVVQCRWSPVRVDTNQCASDEFYSISQLNHYPVYLAMLLFVAMAYCVCKSMIAFKLSYTYPYFEKLTVITPVNTALLLLVFFTLTMVLNFHLTRAMSIDPEFDFNPQNTKRRKWMAFCITAVMFGGVVAAQFCLLDRVVNQDALGSYFPSQVYSWNVFRWRDTVGINDNHRSIPYTLILFEAVLLAVWLVQICYCQWTAVSGRLDGVWQRLCDWLSGLEDRAGDRAAGVWNWALGRLQPVTGNAAVRCAVGVLGAAVNFCRKNFVLSIMVLIVLIGCAWWFDSVSRWLVVAALVWTLFCLWDAILLALKTLFPYHVMLLLVVALVGPMLGNFGTAFISLAVIVGLCRALTSITFDRPENMEYSVEFRHIVFFQMVIIATAYIGCAMIADNGYMTNFLGFLMAIMCFYFIMDRNTEWNIDDSEDVEKESRWVSVFMLFAIVMVVSLPSLCSKLFSADEVNYSRVSRRILLYSNFDNLQKSGYRYAENDAEFMTIMSHYMQVDDGSDPLSNEDHFLHPSVSTGQSPVVLNDLSVPIAFISSYGIIRASMVYFLLLLSLLLLTLQFSVGHEPSDGDPESYLTYATQRRLLAVFMWVGSSIYIYLSYLDWVPFTGRLNPGFGVDAVGEALETAILLAFMAAVTISAKDKTDPST